MVDDDTPPERARNGEPDRGHRDREQSPLDVLGRSTLVGRNALPPAPAAPPTTARPGAGSAPPAPRQEPATAPQDRARASAAPRVAPRALPSVFLEKADDPEDSAPADKPTKKGGKKSATAHADGATATREPSGRTVAPESAITLWGGNSSGKSTLLAALSQAVQDPLYGKWALYPEDHASQAVLDRLEGSLYRNRTFPSATIRPEGLIRFTLAGDLGGTRFSQARRRFLRRATQRAQDQTEFQVSVRDMPGEAFDLHSDTGKKYGDELIRDLSDSRAMVYVVDPVREWLVNDEDGPLTHDTRQSADFFSGVLRRVATEIHMRGERQGNHLPHSIAVCIAKFDDDRIFRLACEQGNIRVNPRTGQPQVVDAKRLYEGLCHAIPQSSLPEIQKLIGQYFAPERIGYFACSAVGFWVDPDRGFDIENPSLINHAEDAVHFLSTPRPVNVLEPYLFLRGFGPVHP
ncbi:hypothetical protein ACIRPX_35365 [Streptomyces sp. NPDC101225]|uniref:hypothetical protein n=1 Tax=Streptomyces sp. NPDC101225 TaxID=3366135 RepID=UPI0038104BFC